MNRHANVVMLEQVASHLGTLLEQVVFVGGAVTSLLITDLAATEVRFTKDVDVIVQVTSHADYYQLEKRALGSLNGIASRRQEKGYRGQVFWERDFVLKPLHKIPAPACPLSPVS